MYTDLQNMLILFRRYIDVDLLNLLVIQLRANTGLCNLFILKIHRSVIFFLLYIYFLISSKLTHFRPYTEIWYRYLFYFGPYTDQQNLFSFVQIICRLAEYVGFVQSKHRSVQFSFVQTIHRHVEFVFVQNIPNQQNLFVFFRTYRSAESVTCFQFIVDINLLNLIRFFF